MLANRKKGPTRAGVVASLMALVLAIPLSACAGENRAHRSCSTGPIVSGEDDVVGSGGCLDEIYRQIYHPGRGTDFGA